MRVISFTAAQSARQYLLCWTALVFEQHQLAPAERRVHGRIMDHFEGVSKSKDSPELQSGGAELCLEEAEFALLEKLVSSTVWKPVLSREVTALEDYLKQIPESKPEKPC